MSTIGSKLLRIGGIIPLLLVVHTSYAGPVITGGGTYHRLCPDHIGGDREYASNGPRVVARVRLFTNHARTLLYANFYMHQIETKRDWSEAQLHRNVLVYRAPRGKRIRFNSRQTVVRYTDNDHGADRFNLQNNVVRYIEMKGDTRGKDIGNCTGDDAYLTVGLASIFLWVE